MTPMEEQSTILALFGRRILGQYPAAPSSPGLFVLLLRKVSPAHSAALSPVCGTNNFQNSARAHPGNQPGPSEPRKISTPNKTGQRFHRTMEMIPALPWKPKDPTVSTPIKQSRKQGDARGASEVRRGTSSSHSHCPVPRSSSHIGPRSK